MHISSLSSPYGIGTMGKAAYEFVDFLHKGGQTYWQILPLGPTGYGDSPYMSCSAYAGNPYFIDLDMLCEDGLLSKSDYETLDFGNDITKVDYAKMYQNRYKVLRIAASRFDMQDEGYKAFCDANRSWLWDYALFMAIKDSRGGQALCDWPNELKSRDKDAIQKVKDALCSDISFYAVTQYLFDVQWQKLRAYAASKGIKIIGDLPMYVSSDSADLWAEPEQFELGNDGAPKRVAGCPPDGFTADGQLWGNPLYNWGYMQKTGYDWWTRRVARSLYLYDVIRIDHFRAFDTYWAIPAGDKTAKNGVWETGPRMKLFDCLKSKLGELPIIAEDLGMLLPSVHKLLKQTGFPGMKVLQFAFTPEADSDYLPYKYDKNCVVYCGTHDNDTIMGWLTESGAKADVQYAKEFMRLSDGEGMAWGMIRTAMASPADTCIITMQDLMGLGSDARMNKPSVADGSNWRWRISPGCVNDWLAEILHNTTAIYHRTPLK